MTANPPSVPIQGRRVLFLRSNAVAPDPRVEKAAQSLAEHGYQVRVFAWDREAIAPPEEQRAGYDIFRSRIKGRYGSGWRNLLPLLRWQFAELSWLANQAGRGALIHACDFDTILPAWLVSRLRGCTLVYDIFDFYADNLTGLPAWLRQLIARMERAMIARADGVILTDESRLEQIAPATPHRLCVIANTPRDANPQGEVTIPDQFSIIYVGQLLRNRGLETVIEILSRHPEWQMTLAGFGADAALLRDQAAGLKNISLHGQVGYDQAIALMRPGSVLLALYDPDLPNHRYASPNKIFEAMMLAKPVLVSKATGVDQLVETHGTGVAVDYHDPAAIEAALRRMADDPDWLRQMGQRARRCYEEMYSWQVMEQRLISFYDDLP